MFREALKIVLDRLQAARSKGLVDSYVLIGGLAVSAWGIPRATQDLDFAIGLGTSRPDALAVEMRGRYQAGGDDDPLRGVIDGHVEGSGGAVRFQLIMLPDRLVRHVFESIAPMVVMDCHVPVVSWQGLVLVLLKLYGWGPQDQVDAEQILRVQRPTGEQLHVLAQQAQQLDLAEEWASLTRRIESL